MCVCECVKNESFENAYREESRQSVVNRQRVKRACLVPILINFYPYLTT